MSTQEHAATVREHLLGSNCGYLPQHEPVQSLDWLVARITELEQQIAAPRMGMTVVPSDQYEREKLRADGAEARANTLTEALERLIGAGVERWHASDQDDSTPLREWLGLTWDEYKAWAEGGAAALAAVTTQEPA